MKQEAASTEKYEINVAEIELEERVQNEVIMPDRCIIPWVSREGSKRNVNFWFELSNDRIAEYSDKETEGTSRSRFFFKSPTVVTFTTLHGTQKFSCDPKSQTAKMTYPDGTSEDLVSLVY